MKKKSNLRVRLAAAHRVEGGGNGKKEAQRQAVHHCCDRLGRVDGPRQQLARTQRRWCDA